MTFTKKTLPANVKAGETVGSGGGYAEGGKTVYFIIKATEDTSDKMSVELDKYYPKQ